MIKSLKINSGFAFDLPHIGNREFQFGPDINILYGPNGCGKSSILKIMAGYSAIPTKDKTHYGGWSKFQLEHNKSEIYPEAFKETTYGNVEAIIDWDGTPNFLNAASHDHAHNIGYFVENNFTPDGIMDMREQISLTTGHCSDGELRLRKIFKLVEVLKIDKKWNLNTSKNISKQEKSFNKYIQSLPCNGKPTLFLDESDKSLNLKNQIDFWTKFIVNLSVKFQVVIASHSLIPVLMPKLDIINIIDIVPDYSKNSFEDIAGLLAVKKIIEEKQPV